MSSYKEKRYIRVYTSMKLPKRLMRQVKNSIKKIITNLVHLCPDFHLTWVVIENYITYEPIKIINTKFIFRISKFLRNIDINN